MPILRNLSRPLSSFTNSLLRLLGMSHPQTNAEVSRDDFIFPEERISVVKWLRRLEYHYLSGHANGNKERSFIEGILVSEIYRLKEKSDSEHEYIVIKAQVPGGRHRLFKIERVVDMSETPLPKDGISALVPLGCCASSASLKWYPASDDVIMVRKVPPNDTDIVVEKIKIGPSCGMTIVHVAMAANVVHEKEDVYKLLRHQCYWYSDTIVRLLAAKFSVVTNPSVSIPSDADEMWTVQETNSLAGKWKKIPIQKTKKAIIKEVLVLYNERDAAMRLQKEEAQRQTHSITHLADEHSNLVGEHTNLVDKYTQVVDENTQLADENTQLADAVRKLNARLAVYEGNTSATGQAT